MSWLMVFLMFLFGLPSPFSPFRDAPLRKKGLVLMGPPFLAAPHNAIESEALSHTNLFFGSCSPLLFPPARFELL